LALDVGKLTRLKAAIDSTTGIKADATSAIALVSAARQYRSQVTAALEGDLKAEFEALFPLDTTPVPTSGFGMRDMVHAAGQAEEGRARLLGMSGWLAGLVQVGDK
jgi:hypothetical protein